MADVVYIPEKKLDKILSILDSLKVEIKELKSKREKEPLYGSDKWWEWSDRKSLQDIKAGRYKVFHTPDELHEHLDSLK